jgi:acyl-CoA thioester hydrolase
MAEPFRVSVVVRGYELDTQGHLNQAVYLQYAEHARWELLRAAGVPQDRLLASGVGPVALESTIRYLRELRGGDEITVSCAFEWGSGKTFRLAQRFELPDGTLVAEVTGVGGLLDLTARRLVPEPGKHLRSLATAPELLGV